MGVCPQCEGERLVKNGSAAGKPKKWCKQCGCQLPCTTPAWQAPRSDDQCGSVVFAWHVHVSHGVPPPGFNPGCAHLDQGLGHSLRRDARAHGTPHHPTTRCDVALPEEQTRQTLDVEGPRLGHGTATGLGMWAAGQEDAEEDGRSPRAMGRHNVQHGQVGPLCVSHLTGQSDTAQTTTHDIERPHCRQRHWFGCFKRESIFVSNAQEMVDLTMALFANFGSMGTRMNSYDYLIV